MFVEVSYLSYQTSVKVAFRHSKWKITKPQTFSAVIMDCPWHSDWEFLGQVWKLLNKVTTNDTKRSNEMAWGGVWINAQMLLDGLMVEISVQIFLSLNCVKRPCSSRLVCYLLFVPNRLVSCILAGLLYQNYWCYWSRRIGTMNGLGRFWSIAVKNV